MQDEKEGIDDGLKRSDGLSDLIKGAISSGVRSVFVTEEGLRNMIADFVPKEVSAYIKTQLDGVKKEVYSTLVSEFTTFLEQMDLGTEARKIFSGMKVVVKAEIQFVEEPKVPKKRKK